MTVNEILLPILVLGPSLLAMIRAKDYWPFSSYPMFSKAISLSDVEVFRVALETTEGELIWWRSEFFRYPEYVGRKLQRLHKQHRLGGKVGAFASLDQQQLLIEVLRVIEVEEGTTNHYQSLHIVRRTIDPLGVSTLRPQDNTVARFPIASLKKVNRAD